MFQFEPLEPVGYLYAGSLHAGQLAGLGAGDLRPVVLSRLIQRLGSLFGAVGSVRNSRNWVAGSNFFKAYHLCTPPHAWDGLQRDEVAQLQADPRSLQLGPYHWNYEGLSASVRRKPVMTGIDLTLTI